MAASRRPEQLQFAGLARPPDLVPAPPPRRLCRASLAVLVPALAVGVVASLPARPHPITPRSPLSGAEAVAARLVALFESSPTPTSSPAAAGLATPALARVLSAPSAGGEGMVGAGGGVVVAATVRGFEVVSDGPDLDLLLARAVVVDLSGGFRQSSEREIPVSVAFRGGRWEVSDIDGLVTASPRPRLPSGSPDAGSIAPKPTMDAHGPGAAGPDGLPTAQPAAVVAVSPLPGAVGDIPSTWLPVLAGAPATRCPGLSWSILAGIGKVESDFGRSTLPGVHSGANSAGAEGPMQFEPATFADYATVAPGGADPASVYDTADAVYSAARLLCADGAADAAGLYNAIFAYNHSGAYVSLVEAYAAEYQADAEGSGSPSLDATSSAVAADDGPAVSLTDSGTSPTGRGLGSVVVADAERYLGTPYVWGGENPRIGFDCSGLVQWVYAEAGISLPRVAQDQYDSGPHLAADATLMPGDLVFFGSGPRAVEHVGIYVGSGELIDAPHTGAVVRFDRLAGFDDPPYVGATRPEIPDVTTVAGIPVLSGPSDPTLTDVAVPGGDGAAGASGGHRHRGPAGPPGPAHWPGASTTTTTWSGPAGGGGRHRRRGQGANGPGGTVPTSTTVPGNDSPTSVPTSTTVPATDPPVSVPTTTTGSAPYRTGSTTTIPWRRPPGRGGSTGGKGSGRGRRPGGGPGDATHGGGPWAGTAYGGGPSAPGGTGGPGAR